MKQSHDDLGLSSLRGSSIDLVSLSACLDSVAGASLASHLIGLRGSRLQYPVCWETP